MDLKTVACAQAIATFTLVGITGYQSFRNLLEKRGKRYSAAKSIQEWVRGHKILIRLHKKNVSATQIEIWWRRIIRKRNLSKIFMNKNDKKQLFSFPSSSLINGIENIKKLVITYIIADWWKTAVPDSVYSNDAVDMLCTNVTGNDLKKVKEIETVAVWWKTIISEYRLAVENLLLAAGCIHICHIKNEKKFDKLSVEQKFIMHVQSAIRNCLNRSCLKIDDTFTDNNNVDLEISKYQQESKIQENSSSNYKENIRTESFMEGDLEIQQIPLKKCSPMFSLFGENINEDKNEESNKIWKLSQHELCVMQDFKINSISESSDSEIKADILSGIESKCEDFMNLHIEDNEMGIKSIYGNNPFAEEISMQYIENEKEAACRKLQIFWKMTREREFYEEKIKHIIYTVSRFLFEKKALAEQNVACTKIQIQWKKMKTRKIYQEILKSIMIIKTANRGFLMRKQYLCILKKKNKCCRKLQMWWKKVADRTYFAKITLMQAFGKGYVQRKFWKIKIKESCINNLKVRYENEKTNIVTIQIFIRCYLTWFHLKGNIMEMSKVFLSMMNENLEHFFVEIKDKKSWCWFGRVGTCQQTVKITIH